MKIRTDFVTNSSSSSFILAYNNKEDAIASISQEVSGEALTILLSDVQNATPLTEENLAQMLDDEADLYAHLIMFYGEGARWSSSKDTWEKRWQENNPGKTYSDTIRSEEYAMEKQRIKTQFIQDMRKKIGEKAFVLYLSYSDEDGRLFADLEHEIVPFLSGTVERFSHH